jgi:DNA repair photolyase
MRHGSNIDPPNRFEAVYAEPDFEHLEWDQEHLRSLSDRKIEYLSDSSKSIVSQNDSPDIPFRYSLNPYRGCIHGCAYCYARPGHEYLGFNAGLDFETRIVVKHEAPELFREFLARDSWKPEPITFSGVTDCYQPAERQFRLTRRCLEVASECRQPVGIVTKNALVVRDLDVLRKMAADDLVRVFVSVTTLDPQLARELEPRTSIPSARLRAIGMLAEAGIPVGVMLAPVIPGLNDAEIPAILQAAADAGAMTASYILLRLPLTVEPVFQEWLRRTQPLRAERVLGRIRETRGGKLNSSTWGERMAGTGEIAEQIGNLFRLFRRKHGLDRKLPPQNCTLFRPPVPRSGQMRLFD